MRIKVLPDKYEMGRLAAEHAAQSIRSLLQEQAAARLIAATGASQFEFLAELTTASGIDWRRVELFHLDEYVGLPITHPASFRKYLLERLVQKTSIVRFHGLNGESDASAAAKEVGRDVSAAPIGLAFVGIGENGHLAFNDPPADFDAEDPYIIVKLDEACRQQQVNEGWFASLADVPIEAISMSVRQILRSNEIIALVPEARKAAAVKHCFEGEISPLAPASILRAHNNTTVYLDKESASLLSPKTLANFAAAQAT